MAKLIRWETPFTNTQYPSVGLVVSTGPEASSLLKAIVAPHGIDKYPKYLVDFGDVVAFTCMEEAFSPDRDFDHMALDEKGLSAYQYIDSPWVESYEQGIEVISGGCYKQLFHYLIFGGDNNIEVVTPHMPIIASIEEIGVLRIDYPL